jgi:hypothetical protein
MLLCGEKNNLLPCQKYNPGRDSNLRRKKLNALPVNWHVLVSGRKEKGKRKRKG